MSGNDPAALLELAVHSARAAGELLIARFGGPQSGLSAKSSHTDLVSDADRDAEAALVGILLGERPADGVVGEEGSSVAGSSGVEWIVDPLDGTINYLWGIPHWAVSIACRDAGGDVLGVVFDPCRDELFTAARGGPAHLNDRELRLSESDDLAEALMGTGFAYDGAERVRQARTLERILPRVRDIRRAGSAALDLAWVAAGRLDAFYETGLNEWDWAGGAMVVRTAGGTTERLPNAGGPDGFLAARPGLGAPLLVLVAGG